MARLFFCIVLCLCLSPASLVCQSNTIATSTQLLKTAEAGDAQAQFQLARAYEDGKGVAQDDARAVEWFRKSADQGNDQAQNSLGVMYALGRGVPRDREEAVRWYKKAAKQGLSEAIYNVATSYYNGDGIDEDVSLAYAWMMAAQRRGDSQANESLQHLREELHNQTDQGTFELAQIYEKGEELPQDLPSALGLYLEIANQKQNSWSGQAQYKLCLLHITGTGVPQDYSQARDWCKKSGTPFSNVVLGRLSEKGLGGDRNLKDALDYYGKAAALNVADGYLEAGRLQAESGSHEGEKKAYFWYAVAVQYHLTGAAEKMQNIGAHLNEKEIAEQQKQVVKWLKMSLTERAEELKKH